VSEIYRQGRVTVTRLGGDIGRGDLVIETEKQERVSRSPQQYCVKKKDVADLVAVFDLALGRTGTTLGAAETVISIVAWLRSLSAQVSDETAAQIEAIADGILEHQYIGAHEAALRGTSCGIGPISIDLAMARKHDWTEEQIARSATIIFASSRMENRIACHRKGHTRICGDCEQWTVPEGECHLCKADREAHARRMAAGKAICAAEGHEMDGFQQLCTRCQEEP
jgi:hypothetical protein